MSESLGVAWSLSLLCVTACGVDPYVCAGNDQCVVGDREGLCEADGFCSYPDAECDAGWRYSDNAGAGRAGVCVPLPGGESSSGSAGSEDDLAADGSEDGGGPGCGDGVVEMPEECDDGNDVDGDGCSADCRRSGRLLWTWNGPAGTALVGIAPAADGRVFVAGNDASELDAAAFVTELVVTGDIGGEVWPAVPIAAPGRARSAVGIVAGVGLTVAGVDSEGSDLRAWAAMLDLDGTSVAVAIDDTSQDEQWVALVAGAAGAAALVGQRADRGWIRWTDPPAVDWDVSAPGMVLAAAGRADGTVGVLLDAPSRWLVVSRGGAHTRGGDLDGVGAAATFASDGGLVIGGELGGAPWVQRYGVDGTALSSWTEPTGGRIVAMAAVGEDVVAVDEAGTLVRIDPGGNARWSAPVPETATVAAAAFGGGRLVLAGTRNDAAWAAELLP